VTDARAVPATKPTTKVSAALSESAVFHATVDQSMADLCCLLGSNLDIIRISNKKFYAP
jgi:hypothetical protein